MISDKAIPVVVITAIFCSVAAFSTVVRCCVRRYPVRMVGWDDCFMVAASFAFIGYSAVVYLGAYYGMGYRQRDLIDDKAEQTYLMWWIGYILYCITITLTRVSIGFFFLRISASAGVKYLVWGNIGATALAWFVYSFIIIFQCTPVQSFWKKAHPGITGDCIPNPTMVSLGYLFGSVCAACDLLFVAMPFIIIMRTSLEHKLKVALIPIIGMAGFAAICPLARMAYLHNLDSPDFIHDTTEIIIWSTIEPGLAIIANNLATMRTLFQHLASRMHRPRTTGSGRTLTDRARAVVRSLETIKVGMALNSSMYRGWGNSVIGLTRQQSVGSTGSGIRVHTDIDVAYVENNRMSILEATVVGWCEAWNDRWGGATTNVRWPSRTTRATEDEEMTTFPRV